MEKMEIRNKLTNAGLVRVDGLLTVMGPGCMPQEIKKPEAAEEWHWDRNKGLVAIAIKGEFWVGADSGQITALVQELVSELGIKRGCYVPCSNGENPTIRQILRRLSNPDWNWWDEK